MGQRVAGRAHRLGDDGEHGLPDIADHRLGKDRVVAIDRAAVIAPRNVGMGQHRYHALRSRNARQVDVEDTGMGMRALPDQNDKRVVGDADVVDIDGIARHMLVRAVMPERGAEIPARGGGRHHTAPDAAGPARTGAAPVRRGTAAPVRSRPYFSSRFAATCRR